MAILFCQFDAIFLMHYSQKQRQMNPNNSHDLMVELLLKTLVYLFNNNSVLSFMV